MKKPISKSASATRIVSLPSGTSAKTVDTGSQAPVKPESKFNFILKRAKKRTPAQSRVILIRAGIITEDGKLTAKYKVAPKARKKSAKSPVIV